MPSESCRDYMPNIAFRQLTRTDRDRNPAIGGPFLVPVGAFHLQNRSPNTFTLLKSVH